MASFRVLAGILEISAALLMLHFARIETAIKINALLGMVGPTILLIVSTLGLFGLASSLSLGKMLLVLLGVLLIFLGAR